MGFRLLFVFESIGEKQAASIIVNVDIRICPAVACITHLGCVWVANEKQFSYVSLYKILLLVSLQMVCIDGGTDEELPGTYM